jgi:hypothetical protein
MTYNVFFTIISILLQLMYDKYSWPHKPVACLASSDYRFRGRVFRLLAQSR